MSQPKRQYKSNRAKPVKLTTGNRWKLMKYIEDNREVYEKGQYTYVQLAASISDKLGFPISVSSISTAFKDLGIKIQKNHNKQVRDSILVNAVMRLYKLFDVEVPAELLELLPKTSSSEVPKP